MQQHGLRADQVAQVRGFADQQPRESKDASDPSNRRISLIVQYMDKQPPGSTRSCKRTCLRRSPPAPERKMRLPPRREKKP